MKSFELRAPPAPTHDLPGLPSLDQRGACRARATTSAPAVGLLERAAAAVLLLLAAPLLGLLSLWVVVVDGQPALYRGVRLGRRRKAFRMYKIRTLQRGAEERTAERLLRASDQLEIPGGRWMRECRLDELPQLWNVVRGEMRFVGPRPERPQVYRALCRGLEHYARRFDVPPGMFGPSQLFTPHSAPKRIRAWLDNRSALRRRTARSLAALTIVTLFAVGAKLAERIREQVVAARRCRLAGRPRDERRLRRVAPCAALARVESADGRTLAVARVQDMNERRLRLQGGRTLPAGTELRLRIEVRFAGRGGRNAVRRARCRATVALRRGHAIVLEYAPETPRSLYVLHQYFLRDAFVPPRRRPLAPLPAGTRARRTAAPANATLARAH